MKAIKRIFNLFGKVIYAGAVSAVFLCTVAVLYLGYKFGPILQGYVDEANNLVGNSSEATFYPDNTSHVYALDGTEIASLCTGIDSMYLHYDDIPKDVLNAFVAIEDKRFYEHPGFDALSTAKAVVLVVTKHDKSRGGSTITQQLVRNIFTDDIGFEKSYTRKLKEILTAVSLERKYTKNQILEFYVNNVNFANRYYGIEAASEGYFGKSVDELSLSEVALLCAIPNNPSYYNPYEHLSHTIWRRNLILRAMYEQGYCSERDYLVAVNSGVVLIEPKRDTYDYESSYAIKCAVESLMRSSGFKFKYNFDTQGKYLKYRDSYENAYTIAEHRLYTKGYSVYTTIDLSVQRMAQKHLDAVLSDFSERDKNGVLKMQGALTVIDNRRGKVIACIGGREPVRVGNSLNRAYQAYMQPGSSIKPLIVYTPAIQEGYKSDTVVHDVKLKGGPKNSNGKYKGDITLQEAVSGSINTVAWQLFSEIGPRKGLSYAQKMEFDKITPNDYFPPAALGGLYKGVTTVQMASGYSTLKNGGVYRHADCINFILDKNYNDIYDEVEDVSVYDTAACNEMLRILRGVSKNGTAKGLKLKKNKKMPIACKTGTTNESRCAWFCGTTPYYSVAVYVGRDDNGITKGLYGNTYPEEIWKLVQDDLNAGKPVESLYTKIVKKPAKKSNHDNKDSDDDVSGSSDVQTDNDQVATPANPVTTNPDTTVLPDAPRPYVSDDEDSEKPEKPEKPKKPNKPKKPDKPKKPERPKEPEPDTEPKEPGTEPAETEKPSTEPPETEEPSTENPYEPPDPDTVEIPEDDM